jgi:hypothetical protein
MNCDKSRKQNILMHWMFQNINELGRTEVCKVRKRMMRKTLAEIQDFAAADKRNKA